MTPGSGREPRSGRTLLRCFSYLRRYWGMAAGVYLSMLAITGLTLATPVFIRWIVDRGIRGGEQRLLSLSVLALLALTALKGVLTFWQGRWGETASQGVAYDLRNALHQQLLSLSFSYHDRAETGQLLSRTLQDVERIRFLTGRAFLRLAEAGALLVGTAVALVIMNPRLALLALCTMPLLAYRARAFGHRQRPLSRAIQNQLAVLTTRLEQNLRGARVVKAFAQEESEIARFERTNDRWFELNAEAARLQAINMPLLDLIANVGTVCIIWYGGLLVIGGQLTVGGLVAFSTYMAQLVQPVRRLGIIIPAVAEAAAAGDRVFEILDVAPEVRDAPGATPLPVIDGYVRFEWSRSPTLAATTC
jgi:ATP-binding cassette, subfamily B, multidrug efflux pump